MSWNYRITRSRNTNADRDIFEIREVYYHDDGSIRGWTAAIGLSGDSVEEIKADLELILRDTFNRPILDITDNDNPHDI